MERLTYEGADMLKACTMPCDIYCDSCKELNKAIAKLKAYEDAEEQGLLLKLPCKEGTEVFLTDYPNYHFKLKEYRFCGSQVVMVIECLEFENTCKRMLSEFNKTVFLTKKEADPRLAKMKGEQP